MDTIHIIGTLYTSWLFRRYRYTYYPLCARGNANHNYSWCFRIGGYIKIYLAAAYSRKLEVKEYAKRLRDEGFEVTSQWLDEMEGGDLAKNAFIDLNNIDSCDILVRFTDSINIGYNDPALISGGRHFETGYAYAKGKQIIVVGGKQNIFDNLSRIAHVSSFDVLFEHFKLMTKIWMEDKVVD